MADEKFANELMSDDELGQVAGGSESQSRVDRIFFRHFGYDTEKVSLKNMFFDNGIKFSDNYGGNDYRILTSDGEFTKHPHWAALGYVLKQRNYPGFNGNRTDEAYVKPFLLSNFGIDKFD